MLATQDIFCASGFPEGAFRTLFLSETDTMQLIEDFRTTAVTLTRSDYVGSRVAAVAGKVIKKAVLELGGSDPFIVLEDADLNAKASLNPLALALPLVLTGGILFVLFPAMGIVLLLAAAMAVLWGI